MNQREPDADSAGVRVDSVVSLMPSHRCQTSGIGEQDIHLDTAGLPLGVLPQRVNRIADALPNRNLPAVLAPRRSDRGRGGVLGQVMRDCTAVQVASVSDLGGYAGTVRIEGRNDERCR